MFSWKRRRPVSSSRMKSSPRLETLENRELLTSFTVTNLADSGVGSLRTAIVGANADGSSDVINFAAGLRGVIVLESRLPDLTGRVAIEGPGQFLLGVTRDPRSPSLSFRILTVDQGANASISGLTLFGGGGTTIYQGGGIDNAGTLTVSDCFIRDNKATVPVNSGPSPQGGGIYNSGTLVLSNSTLLHNSALGVLIQVDGSVFTGRGGGLENTGSGYVNGSTVENNYADFAAGIDNSGALRALNSTVSGNSTMSTFGFGTAGVINGGSLALVGCTIAGNSATGGAAGFGAAGLTTENPLSGPVASAPILIDTIVADNLSNPTYGLGTESDVYGQVSSGSVGNFIGALTGDRVGNALVNGVGLNRVGTVANPANPHLGPLAYNGGLTPTYSLLPGSLAIAAGARFPALTTDQRGVARPANRAPDIGSYQTPS